MVELSGQVHDALIGHILTPGTGTVETALDIVGLAVAPTIAFMILALVSFNSNKKRRGTAFASSSVTALILGVVIVTVLVPPPSQLQSDLQRSNFSYVVPNAYIVEYEVPIPESSPHGITVDEAGNVWFAMDSVGKLGRFSPETLTFQEFSVPGVTSMEVWNMIIANDGLIWLTDAQANALWSFSPITQKFQKYSIQTTNGYAVDLVSGKDGDIWFTELTGNNLGRLNVQSQTQIPIEVEVPTQNAGPLGIAVDREGIIWFTETFAGKVGRLDTATGAVTEFEIPVSVSSPYGLAVDDDGNIWIAEHGGSRIIKFNPAEKKSVEYATANSINYPISLPHTIAIDSDGNVWTNLHAGNKIAKLDPTRNTLTEYNIPTGPLANALDFAIAPDGDVWFTEYTGNKLGRLDTSISPSFIINPSSSVVEAFPNSQFSVKLEVEGSARGDVVYSTGLSYAGVSEFLKANAKPSQVVPSPEFPATTNISFEVAGHAKPGIYTITVGASSRHLTQSALLTLVIEPVSETANVEISYLNPGGS